MSLSRILIVSVTMLTGLGLAAAASAQTGANVANSKHNLSATGTGTVTTPDDDQVCVFCHTPHGATISPGAPLWNRQLSTTQTYTTYTSSSLDAVTIAGQLREPGGSSRLCLSCHDGSLAIGAVNVSGGQQNVTFNMAGTGAGGEMPAGGGALTGYTRDLGVDLTNDHPISLTFDTTLAIADGELRDPATSDEIGLRSPGVRPLFPLEPTGPANEAQLQCASCHDPHLPDAGGEPRKFLRGNRLQQSDPVGEFDADNDIVCLGCHDKDGWVGSAHASSATADETYTAGAAAQREFPANTPVWQAACLNCHDSHTVHGARRLLRDGTDSGAVPKSGGNSALEETCYQCHSATPVVTNTSGDVKNVASDFALANHMPINNVDQQAATEAHDILDADLNEARASLGRTEPLNRHAECTDCHNPHRAMKNALFNGTGAPTSAHSHASGHTNLASGALAGASGVEPTYGDSAFFALPTSYEVKSGVGTGTDVTAPQVTREYQVCLKCHSDYGYDDNGVYPIGTRPNLGDSLGGTLAGTNNMQQYTNQAMEFQAPLGDQGELGGNHRSWHPVIEATGRDALSRAMSATTDMFLAPWNGANIGSQTMYCSDCHGANTANGTVVPSGNDPWGPHGSNNVFILKGTWSSTNSNNASTICFRCHSRANYATDVNDGDGPQFASGFGGGVNVNLHHEHAKRVGGGVNLKCNWCHVAVPHGWKNKALLVNLNDVGPEAGLPPGTEVPINGNNATYNVGPYYMNAKLKVINWRTSGTWRVQDCGSASNSPSSGENWMKDVCDPPP